MPQKESNWMAILASAENGDRPETYIRITPEIVAIFSLKDCNEQLIRATDEKLRLAQAMKSAHLAVQAALIAALAGSMNIGAHPDNLRRKKLQYYQEGIGERPDSNRVMFFDKQSLCRTIIWCFLLSFSNLYLYSVFIPNSY